MMMGAHANERVRMCWSIGGDFVMVASNDCVSMERTTIHGFRALLSSRLRVQITTRRAATHCVDTPLIAFPTALFP